MDLEIQGVNSQKTFTSQHIKKGSVARVGREEVKYLLRDVKTVPSLNGPDQSLRWSTIKLSYNHLKGLDLRDTDTSPVQLIIGTNTSPEMKDIPAFIGQRSVLYCSDSDLILPKRIVKPSEHWCYDKVPYAVETPLGWAVTNWLPGDQRAASSYNAFKAYERCAGEDKELQRLVLAQSEIETLGVVELANPTRSIEDKRALSLMERATVEIDREDAYVSGLLWREEDPHLPNNFNMAKQRIKSQEKKFENIPEIERDTLSRYRTMFKRAMLRN